MRQRRLEASRWRWLCGVAITLLGVASLLARAWCSRERMLLEKASRVADVLLDSYGYLSNHEVLVSHEIEGKTRLRVQWLSGSRKLGFEYHGSRYAVPID